MVQEVITTKAGKVNEYLHHVDLKQFAARRLLSGYIAEFEEGLIIMDSGSSNEVKHVLRYLKRNNLSLSLVKYLITSHHHFDHNGGMWKLYDEIKKFNSEVKILTSKLTMEFLNNFEDHLKRAKRGFPPNMVGEMRAIEENGFKLIETSDPNSIKILETFHTGDSEVYLAVLKTPGHTPDHQSAIFLKDGVIDFIFFGEAVGTLYHSSELITLPVSAPIHYNFKDDMETTDKLKKLELKKAGFSHFGIVNGRENVKKILLDHESFMREFRAKIMKYHDEKDDTRYICEKITPFLLSRSDMFNAEHLVLDNMILQAVYGVMMDLGYRKG
ncbi:MAG: MBL fold metallo-hydrolase [Promethearchaeota archaeon]|nr:MAG: MBL fold metallo-hydrolase [Candidatus Lokiarchaeota archaeon]